ncbi:Nonribosomal peptide synthetase 6 [Frankliniella fusca]|uniref:Nonribosomal peptide synthetase 6 n=1 Tax=Frankliniella fusca TaxID=407009 RepID=A0AAE1HBD7_9NEOP|nr:Nonribosomal peptide synthetase 6 [Frankliniella fusca]
MVSVRKRLTRRPKKSKVSSGTEDSEKENFLNELPIAPLNDNSFSLPSTSAVENNDGTRPSPVQVLGEKCFSPRRAIGLPPVSLGSPNPLHGFPDCIISSSTGILKSRNDISLNGDTFEEVHLESSRYPQGALFNSTPTKNYSGGPLDDDGSALSFSSDAFEEQRLQSPTPVTSQTENNGNSQLSVDDHSSSKKLFTVSSMCLVDASSSGIYPCPPKLEVSNAGNSSSKQNHPSQTVQDLLISQLPPAWELAAGPSSRTSFMLGMNASEDLWCSKQRSVLIGKDGTVQIAKVCF